MGSCYNLRMRVIARKTLRDFWSKAAYADAEQPLKAWLKIAEEADWAKPSEVKSALRATSIVAGNRVVFNIAGNKYRLVAKINYPYRVLYIRFIGTHRQYDAIDVTEV
jgi:mRNA interferase HigB